MALNQHTGYIFSLTLLLEHSFCSDKHMNSIERALKPIMEMF